MKAKLKTKIKKWGNIVWNAPGVKNAIAAVVVKTLVRVGLPAGAGVLVVAVAEAVAEAL